MKYLALYLSVIAVVIGCSVSAFAASCLVEATDSGTAKNIDSRLGVAIPGKIIMAAKLQSKYVVLRTEKEGAISSVYLSIIGHDGIVNLWHQRDASSIFALVSKPRILVTNLDGNPKPEVILLVSTNNGIGMKSDEWSRKLIVFFNEQKMHPLSIKLSGENMWWSSSTGNAIYANPGTKPATKTKATVYLFPGSIGTAKNKNEAGYIVVHRISYKGLTRSELQKSARESVVLYDFQQSPVLAHLIPISHAMKKISSLAESVGDGIVLK